MKLGFALRQFACILGLVLIICSAWLILDQTFAAMSAASTIGVIFGLIGTVLCLFGLFWTAVWLIALAMGNGDDKDEKTVATDGGVDSTRVHDNQPGLRGDQGEPVGGRKGGGGAAGPNGNAGL